jgi:prepilin-type N-terminal cleavage/methylation domain-containing protein
MRQKGFTFVELMIAIAVTVTVMIAAMSLYQKSVQVSAVVTQQSEMQNELRAAMNQLARDLNQAGTAVPIAGISIPSAATGTNPKFACDFTPPCYITAGNRFTQGMLHKVNPANGVGPNVLQPTDAIIITYKDPTLNWTAYQTQTGTVSGNRITMPAGTTPPLNDPAVGLVVGDVLLLQNTNGARVGVVTNFDNGTRQVNFANGDPLNMNQSAATGGNIKSLEFSPVPGAAPYYPWITVSRLMMVTYFISQINTPSGPDTRLMRQVGARTPIPVADHIEDLQFTYDVIDSDTSVPTTGLPDAAVGTPPTPVPNQIRKINITMTVRSPRRNAQGQFDHYTLTTSIGPRNLSFQPRYN